MRTRFCTISFHILTMTPNRLHENVFDEQKILHELKHFLPTQAPLKDFIHHNTLHAFQHYPFHEALQQASQIFGYKVYLSLGEFRSRYQFGQIRNEVLEKVITDAKGQANLSEWKERLLHTDYDTSINARIGEVRQHWKHQYGIHLDKLVYPVLFRIIGSYLDQGISLWRFPSTEVGLLSVMREIESKSSFGGFFTTKRAKNLLLDTDCTMEQLLFILVGDPALYERYLFGQQCSHPGWSGMVAVLDDNPNALLDTKAISLHDFIMIELLLEIEMLDKKFGEIWSPLGLKIEHKPEPLFAKVLPNELAEVCRLWQEAFEWSYYDQVLAGIQQGTGETSKPVEPSFQAMFCIDDRECSLRRHLENLDPMCRTFGTPGFFNVEFYFQPEHGKFYTKVYPAPLTPKHLIKEVDTTHKRTTDAHFTKHTHSLLTGWVISQTLGFWSALKLAISVFKPSLSPATSYSFRHMDKHSTLTIEHSEKDTLHQGLQVGFTLEEMTDRVEGLLKSIGLVADFAPLIYIVGHGASSVNNTHYAGYDCGACSGRPGSVNARVASYMANHPKVRENLRARGIDIPEGTQFVGALHDTTRDEIEFYDENALMRANKERHTVNKSKFINALDLNAKERSRRFILMNTKDRAETIHEKVKLRSVSLFEPRPELNHATNTLCIVGRRDLTKHLFLDRRAFMNSYDYRIDAEGKYLFNILKAAAPVCGGINLEYYFSRVDNYRLGAGTKLPHNVIGLIGVANGIDGDLRPGLPSQMIEVHDPTRLFMIVEHLPSTVLNVIQRTPELYEWFKHEWIHLVVIHPETKDVFRFALDASGQGNFVLYIPHQQTIPIAHNIMEIVETTEENLPVCIIQQGVNQ